MIATTAMSTIDLGGKSYPARWWRPADTIPAGLHLVCDTETTPIQAHSPWNVPKLVLLSAYNGTEVVFVGAGHVAAFFGAIATNVTTYWHNFAFDYQVLLAAGVDLTSRVENNFVLDTMVLHKLFSLATDGHAATKRGASTLENCADLYCGLTLEKNPIDGEGRSIRTGFGRWLGRPARDVLPEYLDYAGKDVIATGRVARELLRRIDALRQSSACREDAVFTYRGASRLDAEWAKWGPLTHHIQLRAAIVLDFMSRNGLRVDRSRVARIQKELEDAQEAALNRLAEFRYCPGPGSRTKLQDLLESAEKQLGVRFRRAPKGRLISTRADDLAPYADRLPFIAALKDFSFTSKMLRTYAEKLLRDDGRAVLHPRYDGLKITGRISAGGELGYMSMPRAADEKGAAGRLRSCVVPRTGHRFADHDYSMIELVTWAAVQLDIYGHSALAAAIQAGGDLHTRTAAAIAKKAETDVTKGERKSAKAVSFGLGGGLGPKSLARYVNKSFRADEQISIETAADLKDTWLNLYSEARSYLAEMKPDSSGAMFRAAPDDASEAAEWFGLTPKACKTATGLNWFYDAAPDEPHPAFGRMLLKSLATTSPTNTSGRPYSTSVVDYLWAVIQEAASTGRLPNGLIAYKSDILARRPSPELAASARYCFGRGPVWTLTGRLRANATYTQRCNTPFQGLAADGLKLALWRLYREGLCPVLVVHDQLAIEASVEVAESVSRRVESIMVEEMKKLVGELPVAAPGEIRDHWG